MKKEIITFEAPEAKLIIFQSGDIITTSGNENELPGMPYLLEDEE